MSTSPITAPPATSTAKLIQFGQLPAVALQAADGAQAIITLYGAHVVSWIPAGGAERLFCSTRSALDGSKAIRGGIPIIFPQFAERGDGMRHGFARVCTWRLVDSGIAAASPSSPSSCFAEFALNQDDLPAKLAAQWPHAFSLLLRVALRGAELDISLQIHNTGATPFAFTSALHSYWQVKDVAQARLLGLQGTRFSDHSTATLLSGAQVEASLRCDGKLDRIYHDIAGQLHLQDVDAQTEQDNDGRAQLKLQQQGFTDVVVWNPGARDAAALSDLGDEEYRRFLCVESALITPQVLAAGAQWQGHCRAIATPTLLG